MRHVKQMITNTYTLKNSLKLVDAPAGVSYEIVTVLAVYCRQAQKWTLRPCLLSV